MQDPIATAAESRRSQACVLALVAMSVVAAVALTACDAAAGHRPPGAVRPMPLMLAPSEPASMPAPAPAPSHGGAALHSYRDDVDPSHAAIGSYRD